MVSYSNCKEYLWLEFTGTLIRVHTYPFNSPLSKTTQVSQNQKGKTNMDFTEARDSEWQWHQLGHMQVCTSLQRDSHASTPTTQFLQAGCSSCRPTNSVKALKALGSSTSTHKLHILNVLISFTLHIWHKIKQRKCHLHSWNKTLMPLPNYTAWWQGHMGVNNLPRVVTQPRPGWGSNSRPLDLKLNTLPLRHQAILNFK